MRSHKRVKLPPLEELQAMVASGMSQTEIARKFNCNRVTVHWALNPEKLRQYIEEQRLSRQAERDGVTPKRKRKRKLIPYAGFDEYEARQLIW